MKRTISIMLTLILIVASTTILPISTALADSWPLLSKSSYCEFVSDKTIEVFTDIGLRTRGTSNPKKAYNAYVDPGDVCKVYQVSSKPYVLISYPTPSGMREGYVRRSDVFPGSAPSAKVIAKGSANTYKTAGGAYSGYTEAGDETWRFGEKNGYYAVVYTAISGSRRYKLAWIKKADYNTGVLGQGPVAPRYPLKGSIRTSSSCRTNGYLCDYCANKGTAIYAPGAGTVKYYQRYTVIGGTKYLASYGNYIEWTSSDGVYKVRMCHLDRFEGASLSIPSSQTRQLSASDVSVTTISRGSRSVSTGQVIGYSGETGNASGPHLHIEVYKNGSAVDPASAFTTW